MQQALPRLFPTSEVLHMEQAALLVIEVAVEAKDVVAMGTMQAVQVYQHWISWQTKLPHRRTLHRAQSLLTLTTSDTAMAFRARRKDQTTMVVIIVVAVECLLLVEEVEREALPRASLPLELERLLLRPLPIHRA